MRTAADGRAALEEINEAVPDVVLLDVMLPGMSGLDVCREIRKRSNVPLIMLTALGEEPDAVAGLEVGADDYVAKPYRLSELVARMRAVLRRAEGQQAELHLDARRLVEGDLELDIDRHELRVRGELVTLALKEFELLEYLLARAGRVVTRDSLMAERLGLQLRGRHQDHRRPREAAAGQDRGRSLEPAAHHHHPRPRLPLRTGGGAVICVTQATGNGTPPAAGHAAAPRAHNGAVTSRGG